MFTSSSFTAKISGAAKVVLGVVLVSGAVLGASGTAFADTPVTAAPPSDVAVVVNSVEGVPDDALHDVTDAAATCTAFGGGAYMWELTGRVEGAPLTLMFVTGAFHGAGSYHATGITDSSGGLAAVSMGELQASSNLDDTGTFTIDEGELSTGTIDAVMHASDARIVRVLGTWGCTHA